MASNLPLASSPEAMQLGSSELSAYRVCLDFQENVTEPTRIIYARVLGYLILYAPNQSARAEITKVIHSCSHGFEALSELGQSFLDYYIRPCKFSFGIRKVLRITRTQSSSSGGGRLPPRTIRVAPRSNKTRNISKERLERHQRITRTRRRR